MSRASKATYVNTLEKGLIQYYFEIFASNNEAYIEKTDLYKRDSHDSGWFTVEEARRCWKALTSKGFTVVVE